MRHLGTHPSSNPTRPHTIRTRRHQAPGTTKQMQNFIKKNKAPFNTALRMYNTVIPPPITHGPKTAAPTSANRRRSRKYELYTLKKLTEFSTNKPSGKTITKKIKIQRRNYWAHIHRRDPTHTSRAAMTYKAGPKKVGRSCYTWNESPQQDLSHYNKSIIEWEARLPNRTEPRKTANEIYAYDKSDSSEQPEEDDPEANIRLQFRHLLPSKAAVECIHYNTKIHHLRPRPYILGETSLIWRKKMH